MAKDTYLENQRQVQDKKEQRYSKLENMYSNVEMKPFVKNQTEHIQRISRSLQK